MNLELELQLADGPLSDLVSNALDGVYTVEDVAGALEPLIRKAQKEAWQEGQDALANAFLRPAVDGFREVEPNPYEETQCPT